MQQVVACSERGFAFGEPDTIVLRNYEHLLHEDCLRLNKVRELIKHSKYGDRYKLLWDGIAAFVEDTYNFNNDYWSEQLFVALVVIPNGPLFLDLRGYDYVNDGGIELKPAIGSLHLQFYIPVTAASEFVDTVPYRLSEALLTRLSMKDPAKFIWPAIGRSYDIPVGLSQTCLTMAKSWLNDCIAGTGKHQICGKTEEPPRLPTRVIDVGELNMDICLHISHPGEKSHYVALSHCWGGIVPIMTTTSTIREFSERLPSELPKSFADAIAVTRTMGQKYLWIDSLCILQDSAEDWVFESSRMDQVYSHALFTISADAAANSSSGFLEPPARVVRKHSVVDCDLSSTDISTSQSTVHVRERGDLAFQLPYHDFLPGTRLPWRINPILEPVRSKLSTRAWAFQERLLSPRTLHFGPTEMAWECRAVCNCECSATNERTSRTTRLVNLCHILKNPYIKWLRRGSKNFKHSSRRLEIPFLKYSKPSRLILSMLQEQLPKISLTFTWGHSLLKGSIALQPPTSNGETIQSGLRSLDNAWERDIVEEYTRLDLTRETDRLSALAGLAMQASSLRLGDEYIAGMWRNTIKAGLSWYTRPEKPSSRTPSKIPLPTWSWASVSGQIQHARVADIPSDASLMEVLSVDYTPDARSAMGAGPQTPASLLGEGYLVPIDSVWFQHYSVESEGGGWADIYRACYRVKWPSNVALPVNCIAMMDEHQATAAYDETIKLDRLDGMELESMDLVMLLTALSKGVVFGLLLSRRRASGDLPEFERVGFINGMDDIGDFVSWSSSSKSVRPMFESDWGPDENEGMRSILENAGIARGKMKIW